MGSSNPPLTRFEETKLFAMVIAAAVVLIGLVFGVLALILEII